MFLIAGAPGSGKSTLMPVTAFGVSSFNADDTAAILHGNSYVGIPETIRKLVNGQMEDFIEDHIQRSASFAVETTLRSPIALVQAEKARQHGFYAAMIYISTIDENVNLRRIISRAGGGGHSAPKTIMLDIRNKSFQNLWNAISAVGSALDELVVIDNSVDGENLVPAFALRYSSKNRSFSIEQFTIPAYLDLYYSAAAARTF